MVLSVTAVRRTVLAALVALPAGLSPLAAQANIPALQQSLDQWYAGAARSAPGVWGVAVADQSGTILWSVRPDDPLVPASTVKVLTTGFARTVLGGDARRPTRVVGSGRVDPATGDWVGSWALELNGDPTLERAGRSGPSLVELAQQLRASGIRRIYGPLQIKSAEGPATAAYPTVWADRHRGRLFAPLVGALTVNENVVSVTVRPGPRSGTAARLVSTGPDGLGSMVKVTARTRAGRRSRLVLQATKTGGWLVTGTIGVRAGPQRLVATSRNPKKVIEAVWASALDRAGVTWTRARSFDERDRTETVLAEITSPTLDSMASEVNSRSLNIGAELMLEWAGGRTGAAQRLVQHVQDVTGRESGVYLVDGSGLSHHDRVSPSVFVSYLARFPATPAGRNFTQLLPANGMGTLRTLNSGFPGAGVVRAKTGTLNNVATVVGYLGRSDGVLLLSLMYNGPQTWSARQEQWKLFRRLGADGVVIDADTFSPDPQYGSDDTTPPDGAAPIDWWPVPDDDS